MDSVNPYLPPTTASTVEELSDAPVANAPSNLYGKWMVVFALNMIMPGLLGWIVTSDQGRLGMIAGALLMLCGGWTVCYYRPAIAAKTILGAVPIALSQLFPILQFIAGMIGFALADGLGLSIDDELVGPITSELGSLVVTVVTGSILITEAAVVGWLLSLALPLLGIGRRGKVQQIASVR